jgi:malate permease and related proteins
LEGDITFTLLGWGLFLSSALISTLIAYALNLALKEKVAFIILSSLGNTAFLGVPFINLYYPDILSYAIIYDQLISFLAHSLLAPILIALTDQKRDHFSVLPLLKKPAFITFVISVSLCTITLPELLYTISEPIGALVLPLSLFVIGANFTFRAIKEDSKLLFFILFITMLLSPLLATLTLFYFQFESNIYHLMVLDIAMPPMVMGSILLIEANISKSLALSSVSTGLLLSFLTIPLWKNIVELL